MTTNSHAERARLLMQQNRPDLAEPELRKAIALDPDDDELHAMLAACLTDLERPEQALPIAQHAIGLAPDASLGHWVRTVALIALGRGPDAEAAAQATIAIDPDDASAHGLLAAAFLLQRRWTQAIASADHGLELDPECERCIKARALALVQLGETEQVEAMLGSALRRDPDDAGTHSLIGLTALRRGDARSAIEHYREALRLEPTSATAREGFVTALSARSWLYRLVLRWSFLMTRVKPRTAILLFIGTIVLRRVLMTVAEKNPALAPYAWAVVIAIVAFLLLTWLAEPVFATIVRFHREGRYALMPAQIAQSNGLLVVLVASAALAAGAALGVPGLWPVVAGCAALALPVAATLGASGKWRVWLGAATATLVLIGTVAAWHWVRASHWQRGLPADLAIAYEKANAEARLQPRPATRPSKQPDERLEQLTGPEKLQELRDRVARLELQRKQQAELKPLREQKEIATAFGTAFLFGIVAFSWVGIAPSSGTRRRQR